MLEQIIKEAEDLKDMIKELSEIVKITQVANQGAVIKSREDEDIQDLIYINNNSIGKQILITNRLGQNSIEVQASENIDQSKEIILDWQPQFNKLESFLNTEY